MADPELKRQRRKRNLNELVARAFLGGLGIAALVLAAVNDHEAIGTALVGAAIAFGLGAAFFDRLIEVSRLG
jgi:glycerol uptake facilitator-like aquaporin